MSLDEIDQEILAGVKGNPGSAVIDVIRPLLNRKSDTALRYRVLNLIAQGYITTKKKRDRLLVYPTKNRGHETPDSCEREAPQ